MVTHDISQTTTSLQPSRAPYMGRGADSAANFTNRARKSAAILGTSALLLICTAAIVLLEWPPILYRIADGFVGWTVVSYADPSCAPLKRDGLFLAVAIDSRGLGCTSSPPVYGWQINLYEYVRGGRRTRFLRQSGWNRGGEIWGGFLMPARHAESFFVGSQSQLERSWSKRPQ